MEFDPLALALPQIIVAEVRAEEDARVERERVANAAVVTRAWRPRRVRR
jgi:hypothetical protein